MSVTSMLSVILAFAPAAREGATAQMTAIGLDWGQVLLVQEYWQSGRPYYAIANRGTVAVRLAVYQQRTGDRLAGPWEVAPKTVIRAEAGSLVGKDLLELKLDTGRSLGLVSAPRAAAGVTQPEGAVCTYDGLNGSGGRRDDLWLEQPALSFDSGSIVELTLVVGPKAGEIQYSRSKLPGLEVRCDTLPVRQTADKISIAADKPSQELGRHRIALRFNAPVVDHPTMVVVDGWRWVVPQRDGHGITRGIVINPR